jgi:hypothetical protein
MKWLKRIACWLDGHRFREHQRFSPYSCRVVCDKCGGDWAMNDDARVACEWSSEFDKFYAERGHVIRPLKGKQ